MWAALLNDPYLYDLLSSSCIIWAVTALVLLAIPRTKIRNLLLPLLCWSSAFFAAYLIYLDDDLFPLTWHDDIGLAVFATWAATTALTAERV